MTCSQPRGVRTCSAVACCFRDDAVHTAVLQSNSRCHTGDNVITHPRTGFQASWLARQWGECKRQATRLRIDLERDFPLANHFRRACPSLTVLEKNGLGNSSQGVCYQIILLSSIQYTVVQSNIKLTSCATLNSYIYYCKIDPTLTLQAN